MEKKKRVLLKLSGEALMGEKSFGHDISTLERISKDIKRVVDSNIEVCIVVGGGNICRGEQVASLGMERVSADHMGMLATVMNALALQNSIEKLGIDTRVLSALQMNNVCEPFIRRRANRHMERGRVVICAAGTGNPYFTTDSAAALRAVELNCDVLMKGTQVDGVYDSDPKKNPDAKRYQNVDHDTLLKNNLRVMDTAAIAVARENNMPIQVFSIHEENSFYNAVNMNGKYTLVE